MWNESAKDIKPTCGHLNATTILWAASHQYCCTFNVLVSESKSKKVCVSNVAVEDKVVEQRVLLALILVSHVDVTKLQARTLKVSN